MKLENAKLADWRAPQSMKYIVEEDLDTTHPMAMQGDQPYTGTVLRCREGRVIRATTLMNGKSCDQNPFPMLLENGTTVPIYCNFTEITDSNGSVIDCWQIEESATAPFIDGNRVEGIVLFIAPGGTVMFSFTRTGVFENFWLDNNRAEKYTGSIDSHREIPQDSCYVWDADGWIAEYSYLDNVLGEHCELRTDPGFKLRWLDVSGRTTLHSDVPRHKFDRFGSLRRIEQLEGLSFGDRLFLQGSGVDEHVLDYLLTLLPGGRPAYVSCALDLGASPPTIARFLAAAATDTVNLTRYRLPDPALVDAVRDELRRARPDLSIEIG